MAVDVLVQQITKRPRAAGVTGLWAKGAQPHIVTGLDLDFTGTPAIGLSVTADMTGATGLSFMKFDLLGPAPILVTGTLPRDWLPGTVAYSYLSRQKREARIDVWREIALTRLTNRIVDRVGEASLGGLELASPTGTLVDHSQQRDAQPDVTCCADDRIGHRRSIVVGGAVGSMVHVVKLADVGDAVERELGVGEA